MQTSFTQPPAQLEHSHVTGDDGDILLCGKFDHFGRGLFAAQKNDGMYICHFGSTYYLQVAQTAPGFTPVNTSLIKSAPQPPAIS
jgi:hypothetical protein